MAGLDHIVPFSFYSMGYMLSICGARLLLITFLSSGRQPSENLAIGSICDLKSSTHSVTAGAVNVAVGVVVLSTFENEALAVVRAHFWFPELSITLLSSMHSHNSGNTGLDSPLCPSSDQAQWRMEVIGGLAVAP